MYIIAFHVSCYIYAIIDELEASSSSSSPSLIYFSSLSFIRLIFIWSDRISNSFYRHIIVPINYPAKLPLNPKDNLVISASYSSHTSSYCLFVEDINQIFHPTPIPFHMVSSTVFPLTLTENEFISSSRIIKHFLPKNPVTNSSSSSCLSFKSYMENWISAGYGNHRKKSMMIKYLLFISIQKQTNQKFKYFFHSIKISFSKFQY